MPLTNPTTLGAVTLWLIFTACGGDGETPSVSTTSSPTTVPMTSTTAEGDFACGLLPAQSSPSQFDPESGQYAVYLTGVDVDRRSLAFDVIQFLVGEDAVRAYHRDYPEDPEGPPNDYYIDNESSSVREAPVRDEVPVRLVRLHEDADVDLDPGTFEELPDYLAGYQSRETPYLSSNPFWLTFRNGTVTEICEQYVP